MNMGSPVNQFDRLWPLGQQLEVHFHADDPAGPGRPANRLPPYAKHRRLAVTSYAIGHS
jgi:hypothetical protein